MKALGLFSCLLMMVSLGESACEKKPTSAKESIVSAMASDLNSATSVAESAGEETKKEPEKVVKTDSFTVDQKLDLVMAVDAAIEDGRGVEVLSMELNSFGKALAAAMDTQIHFMTGGPLALADLDAKKIAFIEQGVGPNDSISLLSSLFANELAEQYVDAAGETLAAPLAFRKEAKLEIVILSTGNGEDEGNLAVDFDPSNSLKANVSAVVALPDSVESDECSIDAVGQEYIDLSKKRNGSVLNVCDPAFGKIFSTLANDIAKRNVNFKLTQKPADPKSMTVTVNGKALAKEAWSYDAKNNAVSILSSTAVVIGAKIEVKYDQAMAP